MKTNLLKTIFLGLILGLSVPISAQVTLISPPDNMTMSSFAASFKANSTNPGPFDLEVSKDNTFTTGVIRKTVAANSSDTKNIYFFRDNGFELTAGTWYWRVAAANKTIWSPVWKVHVETSNPTIEPKREISPEKPYFHARLRSNICTKSDALQRVQKIIPDDLKESLILDHPTTWPYFLAGNTVIEYYEKVNALGYPFTMDLGRPDGANHENQGDRATTLSEAEWVLQHCENCVGLTTGELFYEYFSSSSTLVRNFADATIDLCAKYGKYFFLSDMNWKWNKWNMFSFNNYNRFKERGLGRYFVPLYKTTDPWGALICMSAVQGMGLTGMVDHYGIWSDMWLWDKFGQPGKYDGSGTEKDFPYIFNMRAFLLSISQGGTVTALEPALAWGDAAIPNENYSKYLIPFLRGVRDHKIMIHKEAVMAATKVIVKLNIDPFSTPIDYINDKYGNFYKSTYGLWYGGKDPSREEIIPNTSRYLGIPILPHSSATVPSGMNLINLTDVQTTANANSLINPLYPANNSTAYTVDLDNTIIVLNTLENTDQAQPYNMTFGNSGVMKMSGNIQLMSYIMGKRESAERYWFQVNGYTQGPSKGGLYTLPAYPSELNFTCSVEPTVNVEQPSEVISQNWNPETKVFTIKFKHDNGAVNFTISAPIATGLFNNKTPSEKFSKVYPNPSCNSDVFVDLSYSNNKSTLIDLLEINGKVVFQAETTKNQVKIPASVLAAKGMYILKVENNSEQDTHKLIVQ